MTAIPETVKTNRRAFLKGAVAAGLIVGLPLPLRSRALAAVDPTLQPAAFIHIKPDNSVTVILKHHEMGQGVSTGLTSLVAEELDADWSQMRVEYAPANVEVYKNFLFGMQGTGGSTSIANSYEQMRKVGATARAMLVQAAAQSWNVEPRSIKIDKGVLSQGAHKATFGEMSVAASQLTPPADVTLKRKSDFKFIGKPLPRLDSIPKSTGQQTYTIDVKLPGLLTAVVAHPPLFGATLKSFDAAAAKKIKGVKAVVKIPEGVAVIADGMWPAIKGREALKIKWDDSKAEKRSSGEIFADYKAGLATPGLPVRSDGDVNAAFAKATTIVEATYEFPFLAHATMEPMNCVAWLHDGMLETWSGHQIQTLDQMAAAKAANLTPDKVVLHTLASGGSFGRRGTMTSDYVVEAVHIAMAVPGKPIRLQRTREDDMRAAYFRPLFLHAVKAGLDEKGNVVAWSHSIVGQSLVVGTPMAALIKNGVDGTSVEGVSDLPYAIPNLSVDLHTTQTGVPVSFWRSVGRTHTAYAVESMIDELAVAAKKDPLEFRLSLLKDQPRYAGALKLAAKKAHWGAPLPKGAARGIAVSEFNHTVVAEVAEVRLDSNGKAKVERVVVAVDCGLAVNPDIVRAQMEGGVGFALSAALYSETTLDKGAVQQINFDGYEVLRMDAMPRVEVYIVPSDAPPTGVGEPGVPPAAPAVANALAALTGKRVRSLPIANTKLTAA